MNSDLMTDRQLAHDENWGMGEVYEDVVFEEGYLEPDELNELLEQGIDPDQPTNANPGSEEKVLTLSARYAAGLPLWHKGDCYERGATAQE